MDIALLSSATLALALLSSAPLHAQPAGPGNSLPNPDARVEAHRTARSKGACGPCYRKDPAAQAKATQGISAANPANPYVGKDSYDNVVVWGGTLLYSLTPGSPPGFAVTYPTLERAGGSLMKYYELVQVTTDPGTDGAGVPRSLRDKVRAFRVKKNICAARGKALASPQFGRGEGVQYYLSPSDVAKLSPERIRPI